MAVVRDGAMVAHGYDDCEGDLLQRVRLTEWDALLRFIVDGLRHVA